MRNLTGGVLSDFLVRRHGLRNGRRWVGTAGLGVSSCLFLAAALFRGKIEALILLSIGLFALAFLVPTAWAVCLDVGREHAGAVSAIMNTSGQAGGFVCTVLFGYIANRTGNFNAPLIVISAMVMLSAVLFWWIDATRPLLRIRNNREDYLPGTP